MGFYTYLELSCYCNNIKAGIITWLNEHGVSCSYNDSSYTLDITDFNGMSGSFKFNALNGTTSYDHKITLVTDPGKELILVSAERSSSSLSTITNHYVEALVLNHGGSLYSTSKWGSATSVPNMSTINISSNPPVELSSTADNYLVPLFVNDYGTISFFNQYFVSINNVYVAPGVIISDGTKQFISCGLFLFVEYDPATMSE